MSGTEKEDALLAVRSNAGLGVTGFVCPQCGGWKWGTSRCTEAKDVWRGHCHGDNKRAGCGYSWHRMTEDEKVFAAPNVELTSPPKAGLG